LASNEALKGYSYPTYEKDGNGNNVNKTKSLDTPYLHRLAFQTKKSAYSAKVVAKK
jgi:hypothetical protein